MDQTKSPPHIFYGWWVVAGLALVYGATNGIVMHTLPLIYPDLTDEFGWNQAQVTLPATILLVVGALTAPVSGYCLDRFPPRRVILCGVTVMSLALAMVPLISALWHMMAIYFLFAFGLSFGGLVPSMVILSKWFSQLRGRAVGLVLMASSVGGAVFPLVIRQSLTEGRWREAVILLAVIGAMMMILPILLIVRNGPGEVGQTVDGLPETDRATGAAPTATGSAGGIMLKQALRTTDFYLLAFVTAVLWFSIIATQQHQSIYLRQDVGLDAGVVPLIFSTFFLTSLIGKFAFGFLSDHFDRHVIMAVAVATMIAGLFILLTVTGGGLTFAYLYGAVTGLGFAGVFTMIQIVVANHYAGASYGKILGLLTMIDTLAGGLGTQIIGGLRVVTGNYASGIFLMIGLCSLSMICVFVLRNRYAAQHRPALA